MSQNRVLIVDDSRTAQARLKKMLERYDLEVDTVLSAEEAFGYLSYRHPAVVFLDHHMEGMDGLDALKVIKSNPDTALIPVIMYTSEQGDVYVGQARALGAIDILSKEVVKPSNLEKVLASLGIAPKSATPKTAAPPRPAAATQTPAEGEAGSQYSDESTAVNPNDAKLAEALNHVQRQVSRLFEIHITKVRQEIEDSSKFVLRRLARELQNRDAQGAARARAAESESQPVMEEPIVVAEKNPAITLILSLILIVIAFTGYHLYINNRHQSMTRVQMDELVERTRAQEQLITRLFEQVGASADRRQSAQSFADKQVLLDALGWAVNVNNQIGFGETPLNNDRVYILGELLALLKAANFSGTVYMDTHLGNYCVVRGNNGEWVLPPPKSTLDSCTLMSNISPEVPLSEQISITFLNYLNTAPILQEGNIEVELSTHNYSAPKHSYPANNDTFSADVWNNIAQKNSRVSLLFSAD